MIFKYLQHIIVVSGIMRYTLQLLYPYFTCLFSFYDAAALTQFLKRTLNFSSHVMFYFISAPLDIFLHSRCSKCIHLWAFKNHLFCLGCSESPFPTADGDMQLNVADTNFLVSRLTERGKIRELAFRRKLWEFVTEGKAAV